MDQRELIPHLFRTEFTKITAVLCNSFGIHHLQTAEDIASETFIAAMENWPYKGIPANPVAWLYNVAKNKTRNLLKRDRLFREKISRQLLSETESSEYITLDLSDKNIRDSQLQMIFAICHPSLSAEAQIGLALRILCGFGIEEIANAFMTSADTINKRLYRAKAKIRSEKITLVLPSGTEINQRLETVLRTLYLLFNEGYYSESNDRVLREDLCYEAMRLMEMLLESEGTNLPAVHALYALMCFHASRFEARMNDQGEIILYNEQDESLWNKELITRGTFHLQLAGHGNLLTTYHLEAGIAFWHTVKTDTVEKWENILQLYNRLLQLHYTPVAALNRTYALSKANGKEEAIREAEKLNLNDNQYYFILLGELYTGLNNEKAATHFQRAYALAKSNTEKRQIQLKLEKIAGEIIYG